jgi:hypothetical protein
VGFLFLLLRFAAWGSCSRREASAPRFYQAACAGTTEVALGDLVRSERGGEVGVRRANAWKQQVLRGAHGARAPHWHFGRHRYEVAPFPSPLSRESGFIFRSNYASTTGRPVGADVIDTRHHPLLIPAPVKATARSVLSTIRVR